MTEIKWHTSNNAKTIHNSKLSCSHTCTHTQTHTYRGIQYTGIHTDYKNCSLIICKIKYSKMQNHHKNKLVTLRYIENVHTHTHTQEYICKAIKKIKEMRPTVLLFQIIVPNCSIFFPIYFFFFFTNILFLLLYLLICYCCSVEINDQILRF